MSVFLRDRRLIGGQFLVVQGRLFSKKSKYDWTYVYAMAKAYYRQ